MLNYSSRIAQKTPRTQKMRRGRRKSRSLDDAAADQLATDVKNRALPGSGRELRFCESQHIIFADLVQNRRGRFGPVSDFCADFERQLRRHSGNPINV